MASWKAAVVGSRSPRLKRGPGAVPTRGSDAPPWFDAPWYHYCWSCGPCCDAANVSDDSDLREVVDDHGCRYSPNWLLALRGVDGERSHGYGSNTLFLCFHKTGTHAAFRNSFRACCTPPSNTASTTVRRQLRLFAKYPQGSVPCWRGRLALRFAALLRPASAEQESH